MICQVFYQTLAYVLFADDTKVFSCVKNDDDIKKTLIIPRGMADAI